MNTEIRHLENTTEQITEYAQYESKLFNTKKSWESAWIKYLDTWDKLVLAFVEEDGKRAGLLGWSYKQVSKMKMLVDAGFDPEVKFSFLMAIAIDKDFRRKGLGQKSMEHYMNESIKDGAKVLALRVSPSNEKAIRLYEKMGFKEIWKNDESLYMAKEA